MRKHQNEFKNDKRVWVRGANGYECIKWLSAIQYRNDLEILCDWKQGDKCPNDPNNKPKATATKATPPATKDKE